MRGVTHVVAFGLFGLVALLLLSTLSRLDGWCGEKRVGGCLNTVRADPEYLMPVIALGIVGLVAFMLVANVFLKLYYLRSGR